MRYESMLVEPQDVNDVLVEISDSGKQIVSTLYLSDSQQVLLIVQDRQSYLKSTWKRKEEEADDEEEE